ncbi:MAG: hypothetical protein CVU93_02275, partial [Firmicutes bacterium HGW-Firmicutes-18]
MKKKIKPKNKKNVYKLSKKKKRFIREQLRSSVYSPIDKDRENYLQFQIPFSYSLAERKDIFLNRLKSQSKKNKYKRYLGSPLRYAGGKSLAVGYVIENIPADNIKRVISPFFGGGSVEIALSKELNLEVLGFDIFDILVNYWQIQIEKSQELYRKLLSLSPTKDEYDFVKTELKSHWKKEKKLSSLDLATYYYFNHNLSYGPGFLGWMSKIYKNKN